jgi:phenylpropionate dioxygenase-like ring-hydroxylating dioxygenase large terminal subunit
MEMTLAPAAINYGDLIQDSRVHSRLYYDPAIFEEEMEKIWYREWVFVGHDSEVPNPGDVLPKRIGLRQVFLTRAADGGVTVTQDADGADPIARVGTYRGFVFGSFSPTGLTLDEHLGHTRPLLDQFVNLAPDGEIVVRAGTQKMRMQCNWKMQLENSVDNYHGNFVHESNVILLRKLNIRRNNFSSDKSLAVTRDLGGGHTQLDFWPEVRKLGKPQITGASDPISEEARQAYVEGMERRLGKDRAAEVIRDGTPHFMLFPNLFVIQSDLRVIQPVAVRETYLYHYVVMLKGAPQEYNTHR